MKKETILNIISALIAALFFYAAVSKLLDYEKSKQEMLNQVFPKSIGELLTWGVPTLELILVFMLVYLPTRLIALWMSLGVLTAFSLYIAVVMTGVFGRVPCSCGGILKNMGYDTHLVFNLFFLVLAFTGISIEKGSIRYNSRWFNLKKRKERA